LSSRDYFIEKNTTEFESLFKELIGDKGISATGEGIEETVNLLKSKLQTLLGAKVEVI